MTNSIHTSLSPGVKTGDLCWQDIKKSKVKKQFWGGPERFCTRIGKLFPDTVTDCTPNLPNLSMISQMYTKKNRERYYIFI